LAQLKLIDEHATWNGLKKQQNLMEGTTSPFNHSSPNLSFNFVPLVKNGHFVTSLYN